MEADTVRKAKVERLLGLAGTYKGLNRRQLAEALGRDQTKLSPPSGNPKLDYLVRLADVLDWPVGDVAEAIWDEGVELDRAIESSGGFDELNERARAAHRAGEHGAMIRAAQAMWSAARTSHERAVSMLRESGGWDGLGRYSRSLEVLRRGLQQTPVEPDTRLLLQVNTANTYFTLGHLLEGRVIARDVVDRLNMDPPETRAARAARAFAHYVLGNSSRSLASHEPASTGDHAEEAIRSFKTAEQMYLSLAEEFGNSAWRGIANTCRGGIIACECDAGVRTATSCVDELVDGLGMVVDSSDGLVGDRLESYGWWCVFGCDTALRHLRGDEMQRAVAIFTNKGYEIADRLQNWAMRERLFTAEFMQRQTVAGGDLSPGDWVIDHEDVRVIVGTMGRFPAFRTTGWNILQSATVVSDQ
jgi:hypothetical protein